MVKILVADDHEVVRSGVRDLLEARGWEICAEATNGREAVALAAAHAPEIAVIDVMMPQLNGVDAIRLIRSASPRTQVLVFTGNPCEQVALDAAKAGARGYVLKSEASNRLVAAIESLSAGRTFFGPPAHGSNVPLSRVSLRRSVQCHPLTRREREIVQLLAEGKTNACIATILDVSVRTVETHRANILEKLGLESVVELVHYAIRNRMVEA